MNIWYPFTSTQLLSVPIDAQNSVTTSYRKWAMLNSKHPPCVPGLSSYIKTIPRSLQDGSASNGMASLA